MVPSSRVLPLCGALTSVTGYSPPGCCLRVVHGPVSQGTPLQGVALVPGPVSQGTPLTGVVSVWCMDQCHRVLPSRVLSSFGAWTSVTKYSPPGCYLLVVHGPVSQGTPLQSVAFMWCLDHVTGYSPPECCLHMVPGPVSQGTPLQGVAFVWCLDQCHRVLPSRLLPSCGA